MNKRFGNKRDFEFFGCERYELRLGFFRSSDGAKLPKCAPEKRFFPKSWNGFTPTISPLRPRYGGNDRVRNFPCWDQFLAMSFAQLTYRDSLADIEVCLRSRPDQLYHMGFRSTLAHSTLADANRTRDGRIYQDLAQTLIARARRLYAREPFGADLEQTVYALDSTTIDLCLSLFPWAHFRSTKAAVKLHTLLDLRGPIPTMIAISQGKQADVSVLDQLMIEPGAFYVMDRGYVDFARLYRLVLTGAFFVTRAKPTCKSTGWSPVPWIKPPACAVTKSCG